MECTSCPVKDRKLMIIVFVSAPFVLKKIKSIIAESLCGRLSALIFSLQFCFRIIFVGFLIIADGFRNILINLVLRTLTNYGPRTGSHSGTRIGHSLLSGGHIIIFVDCG